MCIQTKSPARGFLLFFDFLMLSLLLTPFAILLEFNLSSDKFLVLAAPVVDALASSAGQFDQFVL